MMYTTIVHQKVAIEANISSVEKKCGWVDPGRILVCTYYQNCRSMNNNEWRLT
jgi:hypothetical protein